MCALFANDIIITQYPSPTAHTCTVKPLPNLYTWTSVFSPSKTQGMDESMYLGGASGHIKATNFHIKENSVLKAWCTLNMTSTVYPQIKTPPLNWDPFTRQHSSQVPVYLQILVEHLRQTQAPLLQEYCSRDHSQYCHECTAEG